jgi:phosphoribosylanthranilate isomerase
MVKVKICGHTSVEDAKGSVESGADYIGVIVEVPVDTPRKVSREKAREILDAVGDKIETVMVMMPSTIGEAVALYEAVEPSLIQLHGGESLQFCRTLAKRLPCRIMKAVHVKDRDSVDEAKAYGEVCDHLLLDTPSLAMGGSGQVHDWGIARTIIETVKVPVFLAGGLNPHNIGRAIREVAPYGVDVASGVENGPGVKDSEAVGDFILRAKESL